MRIILISHFFPPDTTPGAMRPHALANALSEAGHDVLVLTACDNPVQGPYRVESIGYTRLGGHVKKAAGLAPEANLAHAAATKGTLASRFTGWAARTVEAVFQHPDKYRGWMKAVRRWSQANADLLKGFDVVLASAPPPTTIFVGSWLARTLDLPYVLDLRDLWTDNPYYRFGRVRRAIDRRSEARVLATADRVVVATRPLQDSLSVRHPALDVETVASGAVARPAAHGNRSTAALRIGHFGELSEWVHRDPVPVLEAARRLIETGEVREATIRFDFFGPYSDRLKDRSVAAGPDGLVSFHGVVPRAQVARELADCDLALLLMWAQDDGPIPAKTYEYLASGKRVLVSGASPRAEVRRALADVPGVHFADSPDVTASILKELWLRWDEGSSLDLVDHDRVYPFTAEFMALRFAEVLNSATRR